LAVHYRRILDRRMLTQEALDFSQLNPHSSNFDLLILAAKKFKIPILQNSTQISCLIDDIAGILTERISNEDFAGQLWLSVITQRAKGSADVNLTDFA